ncbi:AzlC family ABC transporter permease [Hoeflea sp. YIM 152468]|uniref:AzlC family ABC transporter permease n=1 Tax=Hoeflea sp. YIM 152468 TaxID=3031759 RepID=UPI0023DC5359|nr:AzlC family ABC transporter permease [Hoeflea sp. YIM 152468]MDF1609974.1 AzlC family ABC transporter permease [Hoeflea sp. YIM 152468]
MSPEPEPSGIYWFFKGARGIASLPAIILMSAFVGFCGFAVEAGIPLGETVFMTGMIWALPGKVLLVGSILAGASLPAAFLTVSLSSIRLMPMVAALIPEIRTSRTPTWLLLLLSHFIAITAYVFTMERIRDVPRVHRVAFFAGFGITVTSANIVLVAVIYSTVANLPAMVAGALFFLTPVYFLTSIWASTRERAGHIAMIFGLALGPVFHQLAPELDILYAGIVGGTLAFAADRAWKGRTGT